jgi:hypothetical protein
MAKREKADARAMLPASRIVRRVIVSSGGSGILNA